MLVSNQAHHAPEIVALSTGENGQFFPAGDTDALAKAMARLCDDRAALVRMGSAARRTVRERSDLGEMVQAFVRAVAYALDRGDEGAPT